MSIQDSNGDEVVTTQGIWSLLLKIALALSVPMFGFAVAFAVWIASTIFNHDARLQVLEFAQGHKSGISQSVNVGQADSAKMASDHRDWLTVQEVATREGVTDRTILNYIEGRRISPLPTKDGREWRIAENFRILPNPAEEFGIAENQHIATP